ncbi:hypothetical protein AX16_002216 [Volvariella volvacea WC 439]|nr:hypothetical protein AX16_002216 [Volvariella volvacea WC 439]
MVFRIMRVLVPKNQSVILFTGQHNGSIVADPAAVLSGELILAFPGMGYIRIIDRGHVGHDKNAIQLSNTPKLWYYHGEGKAICEVHQDGRFTWKNEDGTNSVEGKM